MITLGGTVLAVLAAIVAFWPRDRGLGARNVALVLLMTLYAVPAIALDLGAEFLSGALLAILVVAFLRLERLRIGDAAAAGILAVGVAILGMAAAPALDTDEPWFDYETWALSNASAEVDDVLLGAHLRAAGLAARRARAAAREGAAARLLEGR